METLKPSLTENEEGKDEKVIENLTSEREGERKRSPTCMHDDYVTGRAEKAKP